MIMVFPEANAVIALNGAMEESSVLLPHLRRHFPAAFAGGGSPQSDDALARRLAEWPKVPPLISAVSGDTAALAGRWAIRENALGLTDILLEFHADKTRMTLTDAEGEHGVDAGHDRWTETTTDLRGSSLHHGYPLHDAPTIAGGHWVAPREYELTLHFVESSFRDTFRLQLAGGELVVERSVNINSGDRAWPRLTAVRCGD
jgi:hypothetical protein